MIRPIEFLFFCLRRYQLTSSRGDPNFFPLIMVVVLVQPVLDSGIRIILHLPQQQSTFNAAGTNFYTRVDVWFFVSAALAFCACFYYLSKRSKEIENKFDGTELERIKKSRFSMMLLWFASIAMLNYVNFDHYFFTIPVFLLVLFAYYLFMRFVLRSKN